MYDSQDLSVLTPRQLNGDGLCAGFSLRHGGISPRPYDTLNLGLSTRDEDTNVDENRRRLFEKVGLEPTRLAIAGQVHGNDVLDVVEPGLYPGYDALVTTAPQLVLCITSADCAVVLLADRHAGVAGACHSGWRGTAAQVAIRTVEAMVRIGAQPERMNAYVSPCICTEHFEVGPEVATQFDPEFVHNRRGWPRPHVDLKGVIKDQLARCGLGEDSIELSPRCTFSETDDFFSYRAEQGATGRMMGYISLL